ncbi:glycosyltransferase [Paenibacillus roseipurpureus]|uniref:Glycosyltransferase n=1 Tax=Paenibacillus roseopurpureus TaxID=2918901 RepID=A0AA96LL40_9BACL|nr:glycosyltransferase [Paenibacillus sp. MBLB1832]WNR43877.1 glycosyltransferase [Paenibacillus sp. MBLB1832]
MNCFKPLVTIIIPVYNGSNYIKEAIESALAQTYENIEIIVVNDGSNDDGKTEEIALTYGDRIKYFSKENGGTSTALNLGIKNMKGEYFSWLSHDDTYYPEKIEMQITELSKLSEKNTIMMSDLDGIDENYKKIYKTNYNEHIKQYPPRENSRIHPIIYNQTHGCTLLIPKVCFDTVGLFDEKELVAQDFEFFYRAFLEFPHKLISKVLVTARDSSNRQGRRSKSRGDQEYSKLFIKIIENLNDDELKSLAPSRIEFYMDMLNFFKDAEYSIALEYIRNKMFSNLQISSYDLLGSRFNGHDLHNYLRENGINAKQLVLNKLSDDDTTFQYNFDAPNGSKELLQQSIFLDADIVHMHLIHNIIDTNYLPIISRLKPTILSLHDPFFLGGHCVHHFDCKKWKTHCFDCSYLDKDFKLFNDITALNFALKKDAIQNSDIVAIVASKWMLRKVEESPVWNGKKVYYLPFGIDQSLFKPGDKIAERNKLKIPTEDTVLMFRSDTVEFKGLDIIINALASLSNKKNITLITVGKKGLLRDLTNMFNIIEYDWINNDETMVSLYQACDIFLMPSRQESFGLMAIEAMSCGKMVLTIEGEGTALPEVINAPFCGVSVKEEDYPKELARLIESKFEVLDRGNKCADYARVNYSKDKYVNEMIQIYSEVIESKKYDDDTKILLQQLKKYPNDNFMVSGNKSVVAVQEIIRKNERLKKGVRVCARAAWNVITILNLKSVVTSTRLYSKLYKNGTIDKLRG